MSSGVLSAYQAKAYVWDSLLGPFPFISLDAKNRNQHFPISQMKKLRFRESRWPIHGDTGSPVGAGATLSLTPTRARESPGTERRPRSLSPGSRVHRPHHLE